MTAHLFAYGTLICEDIMFEVSGCRLTGVRGFLRDYGRGTIRGEVYPGIVAKPGKVVEGVLYSDVPEAAWERLDTFEGEMYQRRAIRVELEDGAVREAQAYVLRPEFEHTLSASPWSPEEFLRSGKARFEAQYLGFETLKKDR
jgi:gamma-glutamylcyclotransferase (GGCT)/AIG2-like uncharacterized protein YtfP